MHQLLCIHDVQKDAWWGDSWKDQIDQSQLRECVGWVVCMAKTIKAETNERTNEKKEREKETSTTRTFQMTTKTDRQAYTKHRSLP